MQEHGGADAYRPSLHGRDQRFGRAAERMNKARYIPLARRLASGHCGEFTEVVAGGEGIAFAPDQDDTHGSIVLCALDGVGQGAIHLVGQRVLLVWTLQRQYQDATLVLDLNLLGHSPSPLGNLLWMLVSQRATMSISCALKPSISRALVSCAT